MGDVEDVKRSSTSTSGIKLSEMDDIIFCPGGEEIVEGLRLPPLESRKFIIYLLTPP